MNSFAFCRELDDIKIMSYKEREHVLSFGIHWRSLLLPPTLILFTFRSLHFVQPSNKQCSAWERQAAANGFLSVFSVLLSAAVLYLPLICIDLSHGFHFTDVKGLREHYNIQCFLSALIGREMKSKWHLCAGTCGHLDRRGFEAKAEIEKVMSSAPWTMTSVSFLLWPSPWGD